MVEESENGISSGSANMDSTAIASPLEPHSNNPPNKLKPLNSSPSTSSSISSSPPITSAQLQTQVPFSPSPSSSPNPSSNSNPTPKSSPNDGAKEEALKAAASAMAAVAAAVASNSKMSPSLAASLAKNTVKQQPLLSKHTPTLPVVSSFHPNSNSFHSHTISSSSSLSSTQSTYSTTRGPSKKDLTSGTIVAELARRRELQQQQEKLEEEEELISPQEVTMASLKIDLDLMKSYLKQQIMESTGGSSEKEGGEEEEEEDGGQKDDSIGKKLSNDLEEHFDKEVLLNKDTIDDTEEGNDTTFANADNPNEAMCVQDVSNNEQQTHEDTQGASSQTTNDLMNQKPIPSDNIVHVQETHTAESVKITPSLHNDTTNMDATDDAKSKEHEYMSNLTNSNEALLRLLIMLSSSPDILLKTEPDHNSQNTNTEVSYVESIEIDHTQFPNITSQEEYPSPTETFPTQIHSATNLVLSFYNKVQTEYDSLLRCLPTDVHDDEKIDEDERIIWDLLPPSASDSDATTAFFKSCRVKQKMSHEDIVSKQLSNANVNDNDPNAEQSKNNLHVTSTDNGIEVTHQQSQQLQKEQQSHPNHYMDSKSPHKKDGKTTAASFVNAIAGAATGVVDGFMTGGNSRNNSPNRLKPMKRKNQQQQHQMQTTGNMRHIEDGSGSKGKSIYYTGADTEEEEKKYMEGYDYTVQITREMLGLTVENILERTIVRTVLANGAAKKAGAKVGSLIVKVGSVETQNLTHFETIDELRQSQRPLKLVLRRVSKNALQGAREEMVRLIKGAGFGNYYNKKNDPDETPDDNEVDFKNELSSIWGKKRKASLIQNNHSNSNQFLKPSNSKTNFAKLGEKLVWILTLLVIGLEREAESAPETTSPSPDHRKQSSKEHYKEDAKSVSKILLDFVTRQFLGDDDGNPDKASPNSLSVNNVNANIQRRPMQQQQMQMQMKNQNMANRHVGKAKTKKQQMFASAGRLGSSIYGNKKGQPRMNQHPSNSVMGIHHIVTETPLAQIGDVLHRVQKFLADPYSPPAALLRGEVIALICDVLDFDTEMELSDVEASSSNTGSGGSEGVGALTDLGSAGSLLKLIVRNCSSFKKQANNKRTSFSENEQVDEIYAGNRFLAVVHRLAASRSTSARVTACSLGPVLWSHLDFPHQLQLRGVITRALHDVEVIVRKSTAGVLHEIAELVFDSRAVPWLVLMCERAMTDPEPQLRSAAMTLTWHLAEHLPNAFLGDASKGSRSLSRLPARTDPTFAEVYLLQCKLLPVATRLAEDRTFSVRLAVAAQCDRLCSALGDHWSNVIIDILQALLGDADERVRSEATLCMPRLVESVLVGSTPSSSSNGVLESIFPTALKLLKDPSASVRVSLATSSGELLTLLVGLGSYEELSTFESPDGGGFKQHKRHVDETLIPLVQRLLHDSNPEVTSAALRAVTNASRGNVKEISPRNHKSKPSENGDNGQITDNIISTEVKKPVFIPVLSEEQVLRLLPTLSDLATSPQWRVRQSAVEIVPALLGCTQKLQTRSRIAQLCVQLMGDEVDAVRRTAAECLCLGGGSLGGYGDDGGEWVTAIVIPHLQACKENLSAKQRMLCLKMVEVMLKNNVCPRDVLTTNENKETSSPMRAIVEIAASLCDDKVVNVRLNVGRVLGDIIHVLDEENLKFVLTVLTKQVDEERNRERGGDRDVLFFAQKALLRARQHIERNSAALTIP